MSLTCSCAVCRRAAHQHRSRAAGEQPDEGEHALYGHQLMHCSSFAEDWSRLGSSTEGDHHVRNTSAEGSRRTHSGVGGHHLAPCAHRSPPTSQLTSACLRDSF